MIIEMVGTYPRFYDDLAKRVYRRIFAGMVWPFEKKGAVVVLGESEMINPITGEPNIWLMDEYESRSITDIVLRCVEAIGLLKVQKVFGDTRNREMMMILRKSAAKFRLLKAPYVDVANADRFYISLIRDKISASKKILNFGGRETIPSLLGAMKFSKDYQDMENTDRKSVDCPSLVVALGYALSSLVAYPFKGPDNSVHVSYQPLDRGVNY